MGLVDNSDLVQDQDTTDFFKINEDVGRKKQAYENEIRKAIALRRKIAASETPNQMLLTKLDELIQESYMHPTTDFINTEMDQREVEQAEGKAKRQEEIAARDRRNPRPEPAEE